MSAIPFGPSNPCPKCGRSDSWCWASGDRRYLFCRKVQEPGAKACTDRNGVPYYRYTYHDAASAQPPEGASPVIRHPLGDVETRDRIYRSLLAKLPLSGEHKSALLSRGLPQAAIDNAGYRTLPYREEQRAHAVRELQRVEGSDALLSVPGFCKRVGVEAVQLTGTPGILIPVRDHAGHILACMIRADDVKSGGKYRWLSAPKQTHGCGSGSLAHIPLHHAGPIEQVRITEGPLKADIATALSDTLTIGLPGVDTFRLALPTIQALGARKVLLAFDADLHRNAQVAQALCRLAEAMFEAGHAVGLELWDESAGKGIDDVLASKRGDAVRLYEGADCRRELDAILSRVSEGPVQLQITPQLAAMPASQRHSDETTPKSDESSNGDTPERVSQSTKLLELAADVELFHSPEGRAYGVLQVQDHRETWPLSSRAFEEWLARAFYQSTGKAPGSQGIRDACNVLQAQAKYDGPERPVFVRVGSSQGRLYVDLVNPDWQVVEISESGWRVLNESPVHFYRTPGMRPLPVPVLGGSVEELRPFLNLETEDDWLLVVAWLLAALRPVGPYPIALLQGEQGSSKSTTARVLRALIDPNTCPLRAKPREERDMMVAAANSRIVCFDNLSGLAQELADAICRLSTGGGFSSRQLFTDSDEVLLDVQRPVILTGIDSLTTRPDLTDRALLIALPHLPEERRRREDEFWMAFEEIRPRVLGALLTALCGALRNSATVHLERPPRMADFAAWAVAAESGLGWAPGTFLAAYDRNRHDAFAGNLEADPVAEAVRKLAQEHPSWTGTATELLANLTAKTPEAMTRDRSWPRLPHHLSGRLHRALPLLRVHGVTIDFGRSKRSRLIHIGFGRQGDAPPAAGDARGDARCVTRNMLKQGDNSPGDAGDAQSPFSGVWEVPPASTLEPDTTATVLDAPTSIAPPPAVARTLEHPLVRAAMDEFDIPKVEIRLRDGTSWVARPDGPKNGVHPAHIAHPAMKTDK